MISKILDYTEKQIRDALKQQAVADKDNMNVRRIDNFIVKQVDKKWLVIFNYGFKVDGYNTPTYQLKAKRGEIRKFARLSGVLAWMKRMGISEFKVVLSE